MSKISKDNILEKTFNIITIEGIDKITLSRLAKELDCSKSSIYYYFSSKEELLNDLFNQTLKSIEYTYEDELTPEENISLLVDISFENMDKFKFFKMYSHSDFVTDNMMDKLKKFDRKKKSEVLKIYEKLNLKDKIDLKIFNSILFGSIMYFSFESLRKKNIISDAEKEELKKQIFKLIN